MRIKIIVITFLFFIYIPSIFAGETAKNNCLGASKIDEYIFNAPIFMKGKTLSEIRNIGKLKREYSEKKQNPHDASLIDTFVTLQFEGLEIYGYLKKQDILWPIRIIITEPKWKISNGLDVGTPSLNILKLLGSPTLKTDNKIEYCGETDCVYFYEDKKIISKIEFHYYLD